MPDVAASCPDVERCGLRSSIDCGNEPARPADWKTGKPYQIWQPPGQLDPQDRVDPGSERLDTEFLPYSIRPRFGNFHTRSTGRHADAGYRPTDGAASAPLPSRYPKSLTINSGSFTSSHRRAAEDSAAARRALSATVVNVSALEPKTLSCSAVFLAGPPPASESTASAYFDEKGSATCDSSRYYSNAARFMAPSNEIDPSQTDFLFRDPNMARRRVT